jgi:hypothetical protein
VFLDRNWQPDADDEDSDDDDSDYQPDDDDDDSMYEQANKNDDSSDDSTYYQPDNEHDSDDDDDSGIQGVDTHEYKMANKYDPEANDTDEADNADNDADDQDYEEAKDDDDDVDDEPPAGSAGVSAQDSDDKTPAGSAGVELHENENDTDTNDNQPMIEQEMDTKYGPHNQRYDMCRKKAREYSHLFMTKNNDGIHNTNYYECPYNEDKEDDEDVPADSNKEEKDEDDEPLATPQMSMKKGIKVFGQDGVAAVKKEMLQLYERKVMSPKHHAKELTLEQKQEALTYLMFLKQKWCGKIKGCGCADG